MPSNNYESLSGSSHKFINSKNHINIKFLTILCFTIVLKTRLQTKFRVLFSSIRTVQLFLSRLFSRFFLGGPIEVFFSDQHASYNKHVHGNQNPFILHMFYDVICPNRILNRPGAPAGAVQHHSGLPGLSRTLCFPRNRRGLDASRL